MDDEKQEMVSITVLIAGRPYPLKIKASDESSIRKMVKEINDKINRFQLAYTAKDKQDCLAMTVLTYAVDLHKTEQSSSSSSVPGSANELAQVDFDKLSHIEQLLDQALA